MHYAPRMDSYLNQLIRLADSQSVRLIEAFKQANVPTSTYYRATKGSDLRISTAEQVERAISLLALQRGENDQR